MPPESSSAGGAGRSDRTRDDVRGEDVTRGTAPGAGVPGYRGRAAAYAVGRSRPSGSGRGLRIARCSPPRLPRVSRTVAGRDDPRIHGGVVEDPSCSPEVSGEMRTAWIGSPATGYMIGGPSSTRIRSGPPRRGSRTGLRDRRCPVPGRAATSGGVTSARPAMHAGPPRRGPPLCTRHMPGPSARDSRMRTSGCAASTRYVSGGAA